MTTINLSEILKHSPTFEERSWEDCIPHIGMYVQIQFQPGCPKEGSLHGYWPYVNKHVGVIELFGEERKGDTEHKYWVRLDWEGRPNHSWFALDEMVPLCLKSW